jgi:hypothetical protein
MVGPAGIEPVTPTMSTWYSNQLSYGPMYFHIIAFIICIFKKLFLGGSVNLFLCPIPCTYVVLLIILRYNQLGKDAKTAVIDYFGARHIKVSR